MQIFSVKEVELLERLQSRKGKGCEVYKSKTNAKIDCQNTLAEELVYIDSFGFGKRVAVRLTEKGKKYDLKNLAV